MIYTKSAQEYSSKQELIYAWPQLLLRTAGQLFLCISFLPELVPLTLQSHVMPFLLKEFTEHFKWSAHAAKKKNAEEEECDQKVNQNHRRTDSRKNPRGGLQSHLMLKA